MKSSKVFLNMIRFIMKETERLSSFGYHKSSKIEGLFPTILYGFGKVCKYVVGLPIGIIAACIAYGAMAVKNWFYNKVNASQQDVQSQLYNGESTVLENQNGLSVCKEELLVAQRHDIKQKIGLLRQKIELSIAYFESKKTTMTFKVAFTQGEETLQKVYINDNYDKWAVDKRLIEIRQPIEVSIQQPNSCQGSLQALKQTLDDQNTDSDATESELSMMAGVYCSVLSKYNLFSTSPPYENQLENKVWGAIVNTPYSI